MEHHSDIQSALNTLAAADPRSAACRATVRRAATALGILLRASYTSRSPAAWSFSPLTGDGFPLELAFTTADASLKSERTCNSRVEGHLRYIADPGGPDLPAADRLTHAVDLLNELGSLPVHANLLNLLQNWHRQASSGSLRYGAWIGARHTVSDSTARTADRFKLYVEIPAGARSVQQTLINSHLNPAPYLPGQELELRMLGLGPDSRWLEFYFRARPLPTSALGHLLYPAGLRRRRDELLDFLCQTYGHPLKDRIPGGSVGFSYAVADGKSVSFTLFLFAHLLWGGDTPIRQRFRERLEATGMDPEAYWQVTASLADRDVYQTYHSLVGFSLASDGPIQLSLGVRPPPVRTHSSSSTLA